MADSKILVDSLVNERFKIVYIPNSIETKNKEAKGIYGTQIFDRY